jgi:hypothetical protein
MLILIAKMIDHKTCGTLFFKDKASKAQDGNLYRASATRNKIQNRILEGVNR